MNKKLALFLKDVDQLVRISVPSKWEELALPQYPFDGQALALSNLYRTSRKLYMRSGGQFSPKVCSVARSLSSQDLFLKYIEYSPIENELLWFRGAGFREVADPLQKIKALMDFNGVSLYHEQNHRIVWENLPPAPFEELDLCRYLNFAESIVVTLDLALADQVGTKLSPAFERMKTIYRTSAGDSWSKKSKQDYRKYLHGLVAATYFLLELYDPKDIPKGLTAIFPGQKKLVKDVVHRSTDLSDLFVLNTNQLWQDRYWKFAQSRLAEIHQGSKQDSLYMPENPLDFGPSEFAIADKIFAKFGI